MACTCSSLNFQRSSETFSFSHFPATTTRNFSSLSWPDGSTPPALASLLFDPVEPQNSDSRLFYLFAHLHFLSSDSFSSLICSLDLFSSLPFSSLALSHLCFSICPYCRKVDSKFAWTARLIYADCFFMLQRPYPVHVA